MRSTSRSSSICISRQAFARSTTASGSMNRVAPLAETSWTVPRTSPRESALTGTPQRRFLDGWPHGAGAGQAQGRARFAEADGLEQAPLAAEDLVEVRRRPQG